MSNQCANSDFQPETALHENVEVRCSHVGFGVDPATFWLIADRLAVRPGSESRSARRWHCGRCSPSPR